MSFKLDVQYPRPTKAQQLALDAYDTPEPLARAICSTMRQEALLGYPDNVLIPSAGTGAFLRAVQEVWPQAQVAALDVEPRGPGIARWDFLQYSPPAAYDLIIDNPPWMHADAFVDRALKFVGPNRLVAFLLRTSFWGGQERVDTVFRAGRMPRFWIPLRERPSYTGEGQDSGDSSVFIWQRGYDGRTEVLPHIHWRGGRG